MAPGRQVFDRAKSSIGTDGGVFAYAIEQRTLKDYPDIAALSEAKDFLRDIFSEGAVEAKEVRRMVGDACVSGMPLRRTKDMMGIVTRREGFGKDGKFTWELPIGIFKRDENSDENHVPAKVHESP